MHFTVSKQTGFTMIELAVIIIIIGIISTIAVRSNLDLLDTSKHQATEAELEALARAIRGDGATRASGSLTNFGYVGDVGSMPSSLTDLIVNPGGYATWNGPYIQAGSDNDYDRDSWGVAYVYTTGLTIQSTGSGATITKQIGSGVSEFTNNTVQGIVADARNLPPGVTYKDSVIVSLTYPNGSGGFATISINPESSGKFSISGIPVGNHALKAIFVPGADTVAQTISVHPRSTVTTQLSFGVALW